MEAKAEPRNEKGQTLAEFLAAYDENKYRRPSVTVDWWYSRSMSGASFALCLYAAATIPS